MTDIEIAQNAKLKPIAELAESQFGIASRFLEPYGHTKAKLSFDYLTSLPESNNSHLILVTAISPTPAGEGKTTTSVGLSDGLNRLGKKTLVCLREPSLGPCFGVKGGAAGGGYAQIVPMEDINLHFTGDFHAIGAAHNLLAALIDNHIHHGNSLQFDPRTITWRRVVDMNDRALRDIVVGLGGSANGFPRQDGYDIVVASEVMAILCLANSLDDLKDKLGKIIVGYNREKKPIFASDLKAHGAMATLLKDAIKPNLVQTLENNLALVHGGPFANIAHGCNTLIATQTALKMAEYVVTEAGFGADLGAEKFIDIKCRKGKLRPSAVVLVATIRALKYQGGVAKADLTSENILALEKGLPNLQRHIRNITQNYGLPCVVSINHFIHDTASEIKLLQDACQKMGVKAVLAKHWAEGGAGAMELAKEVVKLSELKQNYFKFVYEDHFSIWDKIKTIAQKIYGAADIRASTKIQKQLEDWNSQYKDFPVCIAKNQYSFSTDPTALGAPEGHIVDINSVRIAHGAGFIIALAGDIMTMPGLPKSPAAENVDISPQGQIRGLF